MVYIFNDNGVIKSTREARPTGDVIGLERMIPQPVKQGFESVLCADFDTSRVWFDLVMLPLTLEELRAQKIAEVIAYDSSDAVNQFHISESPMWLDKEMRVGLMNSINIERQAGRTETNLWFNGVNFIFTIEQALGMLNALELYALDCYNTTQRHIAAINALDTKEEVEAYDFTTNYPDKLNF